MAKLRLSLHIKLRKGQYLNLKIIYFSFNLSTILPVTVWHVFHKLLQHCCLADDSFYSKANYALSCTCCKAKCSASCLRALVVSRWCISESRWRSHTGVAYSSCGLHIQPDVMNLISWWWHCPVSPSGSHAFNPETNPLHAQEESCICNCIIVMTQIRIWVFCFLCKSVII